MTNPEETVKKSAKKTVRKPRVKKITGKEFADMTEDKREALLAKHAKASHAKCYGRGYVARKASNGAYILCSCLKGIEFE